MSATSPVDAILDKEDSTLNDLLDNEERRSWSDLPSEILAVISAKLPDIADYVCFRAVSKTWRSAAPPENSTTFGQFPWLLLPYDIRSDTRYFYTLTAEASIRFFRLDLAEARGKIICGSSHGWLVMRDAGTRSLSLLNPITRSQIHLPPIAGVITQELRVQEEPLATERVFMSSNPSSDDCIVLATFHDKPDFSFCRPGSKSWTVLDADPYIEHVSSVAYHKGKFYIAALTGDTAIYEDAPHFPLIDLVPSPQPEDIVDCNLVKSSGELMLVARYTLSFVVAHDYSFQVFRLDESCWSEIESIGDNTIFVSERHCLNVPTTAESYWADHIFVVAVEYGYIERHTIERHTRYKAPNAIDLFMRSLHHREDKIVCSVGSQILRATAGYNFRPPSMGLVWITPSLS